MKPFKFTKEQKNLRLVLPVLVLYMVVFLLIICSFIPIYRYADDLFVERELQQYQTRLDQSAENLAWDITAVNNLVHSTSKSSTFLSLRYKEPQQQNQMEMARQSDQLRENVTEMRTVYEIGLVFSPKLAITNSRIFHPDNHLTFYPDMFYCEDLTYEEWIREIENSDSRFLPEKEYTIVGISTLRAITYTVPWSSDGIMYALLSSQELEKLFLPKELAGLCLTEFRSNDVLLCSMGSVSDEKSYTLSSRIPSSTLTVSITFPQNTVSKNLHLLRRRVLFYLVCVLLISILLTLLFASFAASRPLKNLSGKLLTLYYTDDKKRRLFYRDYTILSQGIDNMNQTISRQQESIAHACLDKALIRGFLSEQEKKSFTNLFPGFPVQYRLLLLRLGTDIISPEQIQLISETARESFSGCLLHSVDQNGILIILDHVKLQFPLRQYQEFTAFLEKLASLPDPKVCVGDIQEGIQNLHRAWLQVTDIEYSVSAVLGRQLYTSSDLPLKRSAMPLSVQDLQTLYSALNSANITLALTILNNCAATLASLDDNGLLYHHTYLLIQNILRQLQLENPSSLNVLSIPVYNWRERETIFTSCLADCFRQTCRILQANRTEAVQQNNSETILAYIQENLSSAELCVDSISTYFGISTTTLQKLCKKATGMSVAAYIEMHRMSLAYSLLTQTGQNVTQVAEACGFHSTNSFYKAFKRYYGKAPKNAANEQ